MHARVTSLYVTSPCVMSLYSITQSMCVTYDSSLVIYL